MVEERDRIEESQQSKQKLDGREKKSKSVQNGNAGSRRTDCEQFVAETKSQNTVLFAQVEKTNKRNG